MAITPSVLVEGTTLTSSGTTIFTATKTTVITSSVFTNSTSTNASYYVNITRTGATAGNTLIPSRTINAGSTNIPGELSGFVLNTGDSIQAEGDGIFCTFSGYLIS